MTKIKRAFALILAIIMMLSLMACENEETTVEGDVPNGTTENIIVENKADDSANNNVQEVIPATPNKNTSTNTSGTTGGTTNQSSTTKTTTTTTTNEIPNSTSSDNSVVTSSGSGSGYAGQNLAENFPVFDTDAFIASMPAELKGTTITFLNWYSPEDRPAEKANIEAFEAASGINVNVVNADYKQYTDKLVSMVATGDAPDVIRLSEPHAARMKYLQPIVNTGYDFSDEAWNKDVKELYSVNGIQYAANLSYTPYILFSTINYPTDKINKFGFEDPWELWKRGEWTWEIMREMCEEWIKQGPMYYGFATVEYTMSASTAGLDFVTYDGKQWNMNLYDGTLLDIWSDIIGDRENRISVQSNNTTFDTVYSKALFAYSDSTCLQAYTTDSKLKKRGVWGVAPAPKHMGEDYYVPLTELIAWGVPTGAKNPEAVPYFISWYGNLDKYDLNTYFYDERSIEIFVEMITQPNRHLSISSNVFDFDQMPFIWNLYTNATSYQVSTFIQSQEYKCQDKLNQWNDVLYSMNNKIKK